MVYTPIPSSIMTSVAIDILYLPTVRLHGVVYDGVVVCVDRHSGWIVAVPVLIKGLTGAKVAQEMLKSMWNLFGVPQVITSDRGSHFVSAWFNTICAGLGIRHAYTHAYYHRAARRVDVANQQLWEVLRTLHAEESINWVESLPAVLRHIHDAPGETGLSPYEILFGRHRSLGYLPYQTELENLDAQEFFQNAKETDRKVARILNEIHAKRAERENADKGKAPIFSVGDKVWYRRPEDTATKIHSRWIGPGVVKQRKGLHSYEIQIGERSTMDAQVSWLKPYVPDEFSGVPETLYYHRRTPMDDEAHEDEWVVESILDHKITGNVPKFLVHWKGFEKGDAKWEPANHFFMRYSAPVIEYCKKKGLPLNVTEFLSPKPHEA